ncbi:response regulator transcription factor [Rudaea sp.]|uniref:response regulator transcription factor n=1 Tax=Rudaea sp. TaxID=2136325 RepID=UPI00321F9160
MSDAKILLADDDEELSQLLSDFLEREGFHVDVAEDGNSALRTLAEGDYDAMILDVMLPQKSGIDVLRELRRASQLPVLMLTALGEDIDRILGLELGADDYVPKPCNPREIAARLRAILRRTRGEADAANLGDLSLGPVRLAAAARTVSVRGEAIALTGTEFNILAMLMREAGRVVGKDAIAQAVLGRTLRPFDRSIDVHISKLRRKLGPAADGDSLIHTIQRGGYLFRVVEE